jgi:outer membrane protein
MRGLVGLILFVSVAHAFPQAQTIKVFTLQQAVQYATDHYPAVRAAMEQYNAAKAGVGLAKTNYIPRLDSVWQGDRGSRESVLGVLLPQTPNILTGTQGTVTPHAYRPYWTSGAGVLLSWEPYDFGFRRAEIRSAQSTESRVGAQVQLTLLDVQAAAADAALTVLATEQSVHATQADVDRRTVFARSVHALVDAKLRPGADASRADAELAAARTQMILAEENADLAKVQLAELLGIAGTTVDVTTGPFLGTPPDGTWAGTPLANHPAAIAQQRRIQESKARSSILNHAFYPHFTTESLISARGSGQDSKGDVKQWPAGLGFDVYNWEAGLTASINLTDIVPIRQRKKIETANRRNEEARYAQTMQALTERQQRALAQLAGARRVAENTPTELKASQDAEAQARARFQAGLATLVDVAEAQRLLVTAEIDDSLARLSIWRALERLSASEGDLRPFLDSVNSAGVPAGTGSN